MAVKLVFPQLPVTLLARKSADRYISAVKDHYNAFYIPPATSLTYTDSSVRYGSLSSRKLLRETLPSPDHSVWDDLNIKSFWMKPQTALSTGQTQLVRIALTILEARTKSVNNLDLPKTFDAKLFVDPLAALDPSAQDRVVNVLQRRSDIAIILSDSQSPFPQIPSHALDDGDHEPITKRSNHPEKRKATAPDLTRPALVEISNLTLKYASAAEPALSQLSIKIHPRGRLHLQGPNGSGKTTLLALITGEHPLSYAVPGLKLFGKERKRWSTVELQRKIGSSSPDLIASFPRQDNGAALSLVEVVASGFDRVFCRRKITEEQMEKVRSLLNIFNVSEIQSQTVFGQLSANMQVEALLMRAVVDDPPLLLLDEAFVGLDKAQRLRWTAFIHDYDGGIIWTGHDPTHLPWSEQTGQAIRLH